MANVEFKGIDEYLKQLRALEKRGKGAIRAAVYEGARVVADEVRSSLKSVLSSAPENVRRQSGDLARSLYLSPMQEEDGRIYTKIGWAYHDSELTPNAVKAAVLEGGRSDQQGRQKTGFIRKAVSRSRAGAIEAMRKELDNQIKRQMKEI